MKCVDLSICPVCIVFVYTNNFSCQLLIAIQDNLGTNTYSSALLVGEKGAELIAEELGETIILDVSGIYY